MIYVLNPTSVFTPAEERRGDTRNICRDENSVFCFLFRGLHGYLQVVQLAEIGLTSDRQEDQPCTDYNAWLQILLKS
jgi:hypothetical protein